MYKYLSVTLVVAEGSGFLDGGTPGQLGSSIRYSVWVNRVLIAKLFCIAKTIPGSKCYFRNIAQ